MVDQAERRRSQRVSACLPLTIHVEAEGGQDGDVPDLETINISASGVYFRTRRYLAPMTKLAMGLELAVGGTRERPTEHALVQCQGLVVRVQPEEELPQGAEYEVAVFFTWIEPEGQSILHDHINLRLGET
jgi:hypothetical protein